MKIVPQLGQNWPISPNISTINTLFTNVSALLDVHGVSKKNDNDVLRYNFNAHQPIFIIFGRHIAE